MANLSSTLQTALSDLITANHILDYHGLTDGFGHVSLRNPENPSTFYMTGGPGPAFVTNESDLAFYNIADGTPVIQGDMGSSTHPYSERFCHSGVLKRYPNVNAVVHSHSPSVVAAGASGVGLKAMYHMAGFLGENVPVWDIGEVYDEGLQSASFGSSTERNMLVNTDELGDRLAASLSTSNQTASLPEHTVVLQRGHGFVTWGENIQEAVWRAIYTQQNAQIQMSATDFSVVASGELKAQPLSRQEIQGSAMMNKGSAGKGWMYWKRLVESNPMYRNDLLQSPAPAQGMHRKMESNRMMPF